MEDSLSGIVFIFPECSRFSSPECLFWIRIGAYQYCKRIRYVFLLGDFNARVGCLRDYVKSDDF